jgi:hypothetical protein
MRIDFVHPPTLQVWINTGLLHLDTPGKGRRRHYPPAEVRAARALDALRRLGGIDPPTTPSQSAVRRKLQVAVADAARNNPPGTVVEIPGPVSWVRTIVVVPEP